MAGLDANTKLLLHFNGTDGQQSTVDATGRHSTINFINTAQLDTARSKFGTASLLLDGDSDYITLPDSADWDVVGSDADDWTVDLWVYHVGGSAGQYYVGHTVDSTHYWQFRTYFGANTLFFAYDTSTSITSAGSSTQPGVGEWVHVACCKIADKVGVYLNGIQRGYDTMHATQTFNDLLYIGVAGAAINQFMNGNLDELRIQKSNYFDAAPNVGLTDEIVVPTEEYSTSFNISGKAIIIN